MHPLLSWWVDDQAGVINQSREVVVFLYDAVHVDFTLSKAA